ncbi:MAG: sporulation protein YabP [Oscillospiraceae bacterium]
MQEEKKQAPLPHNVIMEERKRLLLGGVLNVDNFDENVILLSTTLGQLTIKGQELHVNKLNVDTGELTLEGNFTSLSYSEQQLKNVGIFKRMFK